MAHFGSSDSGQMKVSSGDNPIFLLALSSQKFPQLAKSLFLIHLVTTVQRTLQLGHWAQISKCLRLGGGKYGTSISEGCRLDGALSAYDGWGGDG
jgi:hypothetical protein